MFTAFPIQFILYSANLYKTATFQSPKGGRFRLLKTLSKTEILMVHYYHSLTIDATIMVSKKMLNHW